MRSHLVWAQARKHPQTAESTRWHHPNQRHAHGLLRCLRGKEPGGSRLRQPSIASQKSISRLKLMSFYGAVLGTRPTLSAGRPSRERRGSM